MVRSYLKLRSDVDEAVLKLYSDKVGLMELKQGPPLSAVDVKYLEQLLDILQDA